MLEDWNCRVSFAVYLSPGQLQQVEFQVFCSLSLVFGKSGAKLHSDLGLLSSLHFRGSGM